MADTSTPVPSKTYDLSQPILSLPNGISLRLSRHSDASSMSKHANNFKMARNMSDRWPNPYGVDQAHDWISRCRDEANWRAIGPTDPKSKHSAGLGQKLPTAWSITLNDEAIGGIGCEFGSDFHSRTLQFGYWLGEDFWGKGIMTAVVSAFVEWLWESYPWVMKLQPGTFSWNTASQALLKKCGFELEGTLKCAIHRFGHVGDELLFGMVRKGIQSASQAPTEEDVLKARKA